MALNLPTLVHPGDLATTWAYNDLGEASSVGYPRCIAGPCVGVDSARTVTSTYTNGWLTGVGGATSYASSITYHPNGMVNAIAHGNAVTLSQAIDANFMQRVRLLCAILLPAFSRFRSSWPES